MGCGASTESAEYEAANPAKCDAVERFSDGDGKGDAAEDGSAEEVEEVEVSPRVKRQVSFAEADEILNESFDAIETIDLDGNENASFSDVTDLTEQANELTRSLSIKDMNGGLEQTWRTADEAEVSALVASGGGSKQAVAETTKERKAREKREKKFARQMAKIPTPLGEEGGPEGETAKEKRKRLKAEAKGEKKRRRLEEAFALASASGTDGGAALDSPRELDEGEEGDGGAEGSHGEGSHGEGSPMEKGEVTPEHASPREGGESEKEEKRRLKREKKEAKAAAREAKAAAKEAKRRKKGAKVEDGDEAGGVTPLDLEAEELE